MVFVFVLHEHIDGNQVRTSLTITTRLEHMRFWLGKEFWCGELKKSLSSLSERVPIDGANCFVQHE